jgi:hypothetical protein
MHVQIAESDLLEKIAAAVQAAGGTITSRDAHAVNATLTAIMSKWFLGGRKVTDSVTCRLVPETLEVHLRETAVETSWRPQNQRISPADFPGFRDPDRAGSRSYL